MNHFAFRTYRPTSRCPVAPRVFPSISHPMLSGDELERLAQRVADVDGVTLPEARHQIANFRAMPWVAGPTHAQPTSPRGDSGSSQVSSYPSR
jgi:hypothetical protein